MDSELNRTPLEGEHVALGARMVPFAGWNMPVQYTEGILAEHKHTREAASLFDICHMGEFVVRGIGSGMALDAILARTSSDLETGACRYNFLLDAEGRTLDDLIVYRMGPDEFFIVVNAGTRMNDAKEFRTRLPGSIVFLDRSNAVSKLDLQGPASAAVLVKLGLKLESLPRYYHWKRVFIDGVKCILSRTGYTGELGYELYFNPKHAVKMWKLLLSVEPVKPAGLGARDTLRLEMGYPLYGHELNADTTPVEAGFSSMLKLDAGRKFIGSDALCSAAPRKRLVGLELEGRRAAREGSVIVIDSKPAGKVSSGAFGPTVGKAVAMGFVDASLQGKSALGSQLEIDTGRGLVKATVVELPFHKGGSARKNILKNA